MGPREGQQGLPAPPQIQPWWLSVAVSPPGALPVPTLTCQGSRAAPRTGPPSCKKGEDTGQLSSPPRGLALLGVF